MIAKGRAMPIVEARWTPSFGWKINLPDGRTLNAPSEVEVRRIIEREVPGSAIRWIEGSK